MRFFKNDSGVSFLSGGHMIHMTEKSAREFYDFLSAKFNPKPSPRLTTPQAARLVGISPATMLRAVRAKKIKSFRTPGGHFRIDPEDAVRFFRVEA